MFKIKNYITMKKIITLLLLFVTVFAFNGCSSDDDYSIYPGEARAGTDV